VHTVALYDAALLVNPTAACEYFPSSWQSLLANARYTVNCVTYPSRKRSELIRLSFGNQSAFKLLQRQSWIVVGLANRLPCEMIHDIANHANVEVYAFEENE
jgi:hypothetical protein